MTDNPYIAIGCSCTNCGGQLAARRGQEGAIKLSGIRALEYIHVDTKSPHCTTIRDARPYDGWRASAAYDAAWRSLIDTEGAE